MGKKQKGPDIQRILKDEARNSESPFSAIVLKEKKEEKKKTTAPAAEKKKPGEIVHGYNPSLSFGDILASYEKTGNPYRMPKKTASSPSSFGDILDEWENGGGKTKKKESRSNNKSTKSSSSYTATKSFGDILDQYEGIYREKEEVKKKKEHISSSEAKSRVSERLRTSTMFLEESEDERVSSDASWSVLGGKNPGFVRKEETGENPKEEKRITRSTPKYTSSVSFSDILSEYESGKAKKTLVEKEEKSSPVIKEEVKVEETSFFISDGEERVPSNVSWSILGGRNESFVRPEPEEKPQETEKEERSEERPVKRASSPYTPKKDFGEILSSFNEKKAVKEKEGQKAEEPLKEEVKVEETSFFISDGEESVPSNVSWSILGGRNESFVRPEPEEREEEKRKEETEEEKKCTRVSKPYSPSSPFSSILSSYEKKTEKPREKTFLEIMEEKGDGRKKKPSLTMNELRRMGVQATLDLHGETQKESSEMILSFLSECTENGLRKVSIITGKGLHSENGTGVLREKALSILSSSPLVEETSPAPLSKGGSGALWVILREKKDE